MKYLTKKIIIITISFCFLILYSHSLEGKDLFIYSPDKSLKLQVRMKQDISYSLYAGNQQLISLSPISMTIGTDGGKIVLGKNPVLKKLTQRKENTKIYPVIREKRAVITDRFNEIRFDFKQGFGLIFRLYDDGLAYRFFTGYKGDIKVFSEQAEFVFSGDFVSYFPEVNDFHSSFEKPYTKIPVSQLKTEQMAFLPVLVDPGTGHKMVITEADLLDYPGMYLTSANQGKTGLKGIFPAYPLAEEQTRDRTVKVTKRAEYIAMTSGERSFPWRVIAVSKKDGDLIENDMVYRLSSPLELKDTSWIKPGKVAWDWWNANNLFGVDFKSGINTATYKYYIDFAAKYHIRYVILDEGWSDPADLFKINPDMDIPEILRYAKEKGVGIIPWCVWLTLDRQLDEALDMFEKWGVPGIKLDFMDRDDQKMVNYYHKIAKEAARHKLLVNFHGAFKPTGLRRMYPNVITREGVHGLEQSKWSEHPEPGYNVTIPFIRMLAGPMDYTPGAMNNAQKKNFRAIFTRPMSRGTRAHQLAMYVVFESPLQMLCDSPTQYQREPEMMEFLSRVPTVWDETIALDAKVAEYVVVARKNGSEWYVGAMTDWTPRNLELDLSFLGDGDFTAEIYCDGVNADKYASDYRKSVRKVSKKDGLTLELAPGGGWAARIFASGGKGGSF